MLTARGWWFSLWSGGFLLLGILTDFTPLALLGLTLFLLSMRSLVAIPTRSREAEIFAHISMTEHMQDFARGVIEVSSLIYYPTFTLFFLFLTWKVIESRRWK